jgi:hypothetical protein
LQAIVRAKQGTTLVKPLWDIEKPANLPQHCIKCDRKKKLGTSSQGSENYILSTFISCPIVIEALGSNINRQIFGKV